MRLYNTLTEKIETFEPSGEVVTIYVCGITPYDTTHLGHAFTYTSADVLVRYLAYRGYSVRYVQNVTDIDDDILRRARQAGEDWKSLGDRWTVHFIEDMIALNVKAPDYYPRATEVIPEIIAAAESLLAAGVAYEVAGNVYFAIKDWPEFGRLSGLPYAEMLPIANERGNHPDDPHKRDPLDFVLWQAQASPDEPAWESPWGNGRPGWHIECSTMATRYLGETIDIHSGGADLRFPHHECEIAQVEALPDRDKFTRYWLHAAMVYHEGEKMSKSLGNLVMVRDLLQDWPADALRYYLASHKYRETWSHDPDRLAEMAARAAALCQAMLARSEFGEPIDVSRIIDRFESALDDDLDTPAALKALDELGARILQAAAEGRDVSTAQTALRYMAQVFGLRLDEPGPEPRVAEVWEKHLARFTGD